MLHSPPADVAVNVVCQKGDKADDHRAVLQILYACQYPQKDQHKIVCGIGAEKTSKTNLALAMNLYDGMNAAFPGSCAAVVCKEQTLNQDLVPFSLTLEIGSCGNTPAQAKAAAKIAAAALSPLFDLH